MMKIKVFKNTTLVSFESKESLDVKTSDDIKFRMLDILKQPFTNLIVDLDKIENVDDEGLNALMAVQRLSKMNRSQLSLLNVRESVLEFFRKHELDSYFFFCDRPKPFSDDLLLV